MCKMSWSCGLDIKEHWPTMSLDIVITAHPHSDGFLHVLLFLPSDVSFYKSILVIHAKKPNHIISSFSSSTHLHLMSTTQLPWDLRLQQDCPLGHVHHGVVSGDDYTAKRYQVLECTVSPSANGIPVPPLDYPQGAQRVESPLKNVFENEALFMAPTSVSSYQGTLWGSQFVQANYPSSTSSTIYADDNGRSSIIEGQPIQLSPHTIPLPIAQARPSFHGDSFDRPLTNATTRRSEGGVQDRASDERAFAHLSLNSSTPLPHATGYTSMYPQDNGSASRPGQPPFVHHANTGSTVDQASSTVHRGFTVSQRGWPDYYTDVSSRSPFPNPVLPSIQGPYPSSYPDDENLAIPLEPTENSDPFTGQSYPPPNEPTEIAFIPVMPHDLPRTFPAPSQPNLNAQAANLHASAPMPQSPNQSLSSSSEIYTHDCSSDVGNSNLPTPAAPPATDYPTKFMISARGAIRGRGCANTRHRTTMKGRPRAREPASVCHAGHFAEMQSRTRIRLPAGPQNMQTCRCGWQNADGSLCGVPVRRRNCAVHFSTAHGIKNMARDVKVLCRWCPLTAKKEVVRHNLLRRLQEVHLHCPRSNKRDL
ncbi:hypothetical protein EV401DRAFT_2017411 [Pisolithus croceorrhizus]|nr:hypothetical protein EV401DRAFT_2017411 [Pisolithus croceorrhizus]